jgi:Flp pilus assembly pilin Flp
MGNGIARLAVRLWRDEQGQDLPEYGIALAVISVTVALTAIFIGTIVLQLWETGETSIFQAVGGS